jgi:ABC-type transport system involved in multi-copper enzyme maturation permease subunit
MRRPTLQIGLPLLAKELAEQAARKRTYVLRVVCAILAFSGAYFTFTTASTYDPNNLFSILGQGRGLFDKLLELQFVGIYLFLPAITCTAITAEKERGTLGLLFITRLGPWTIILEKLAARMTSMLSVLLLLMPLFAIAYSLGGVSAAEVWTAAWLLLISVFQVGSVSILCSAYSRTTVGAFLGSYMLMFLVLFGLPSVEAILSVEISSSIGQYYFSYLDLPDTAFPGSWMVPSRYGETGDLADGFAYIFSAPYVQSVFTGSSAGIGVRFLLSLPIIVSGLLSLVLARSLLLRRAFVSPTYRLLKWFRSLDQVYVKLNDRYTRGIVLVREKKTHRLPDMEPILWRESTKTTLGTFRYLVRVVVAIELPLAAILSFFATYKAVHELTGTGVVAFVLWTIAIMLVTVKSAGLIAGERNRETLDVLLTTPLTSAELLRQKFRGVRRLIFVLTVPLLSLAAFELWWWATISRSSYSTDTIISLLTVGLAGLPMLGFWVVVIVAYLTLAARIGFYVGLRVRQQTRAVLASLGIILGVCLIAPACLAASAYFQSKGGTPGIHLIRLALESVSFVSPATVIGLQEGVLTLDLIDTGFAILIYVPANLTLCMCIILFLRRHAEQHADRFLGRQGQTFALHFPEPPGSRAARELEQSTV